MAYISYDKVWHSEFRKNVSAKNRVHDINLNHLKLKVNDAYKKDKKLQPTLKLLMMMMLYTKNI